MKFCLQKCHKKSFCYYLNIAVNSIWTSRMKCFASQQIISSELDTICKADCLLNQWWWAKFCYLHRVSRHKSCINWTNRFSSFKRIVKMFLKRPVYILKIPCNIVQSQSLIVILDKQWWNLPCKLMKFWQN